LYKMQIFSKLQRNSVNYIFIKLLFYFFVALLNSEILFFPLMLGIVFYCESFFVSVIYLSFFSILHGFTLTSGLYLLLTYVLYKFYIFRYIEEYFNPIYKPVVVSLFVYILLLPVFEINNFILIYLLYNLAFDIVLIRIIKCKRILL
jgi:hypothetical protein